MMSKETQDTLGNQKATNYALRANMTKEEFIQELLTGLTPPPSYFPQNVLLNINGYDSLDTVMERGTKALSPAEFEAVASETRAVILDTRAPQDFVKGFIPNAINIGLGGSFAVWVGTLIPDVKQEILLIAEEGKEEEAVTRLARVGYDFAIGYLKGGFEAWKQAGFETDSIESVSVDVLAEAMQAGKANVLDVRKASEYNAEHIENATLAPLDYINESMLKVDKNKTYFVHCAGGYRSVVFTSILRARGYNNLIDVQGGFKAIKDSAKFTITDYVPQTTAL
jgi:rhodanese-related sulfurtransferase